MKKNAPRIIVFTVLLLGVMFLIAILPHLAGGYRSPVRQTQLRLEQVAQASRTYFKTYGFWPAAISNFYPAGNEQHLLFIADVPAATNDAWDHPIRYRPFDSALGYGTVLSLGRDGKVGGVGLDSDIQVTFTTNE